jgi:hypothetical protein
MGVVSGRGTRRSGQRRFGQRSWPGPPRLSVPGAIPRLASGPLRVAMLAPPWISVPAPGYGDTVVWSRLSARLRRRWSARAMR